MKRSTDPRLHVLVLFVARVKEGFQELLVPRGSPDVFRRRAVFTTYAQWITILGDWSDHFFKIQNVPPAITEVVLIVDPIARREMKIAQTESTLVANPVFLVCFVANLFRMARARRLRYRDR
jgi:hypothetical protein